MPNINVGFEWPRGRTYELVEPRLPRRKSDPFAASIDEPHIRQSGHTEKEKPARRPLEVHPSLYLDFSKLDGTPESCLRFARSWGLLRMYAEPGAQEPLNRWQSEIKRMQATVEGLRRAIEEGVVPSPGLLITMVDVVLVAQKPNARPALTFRPQNLLDAMRIQLAHSIASGHAIKICPVCDQWFEAGGRGGSAKRSSAQFCSDKCRTQFHNQRRAK